MQVKDFMQTEVVVIEPEKSTMDAYKLMKKNHIRHLPVVSYDKLIGIVTDRDLRRPNMADEFFAANDYYQLDGSFVVKDVMTTNAYSVLASTDMMVVAIVLTQKKIGAIPVVEEDRSVIGIISITDVLNYFIKGYSESGLNQYQEELNQIYTIRLEDVLKHVDHF
ncbi:hypothetical protein BVY03_03515 [bacterium K02(2017)]|nr:hypothetical protein BVY03_03515 [bacterium K02(2017)]